MQMLFASRGEAPIGPVNPFRQLFQLVIVADRTVCPSERAEFIGRETSGAALNLLLHPQSSEFVKERYKVLKCFRYLVTHRQSLVRRGQDSTNRNVLHFSVAIRSAHK